MRPNVAAETGAILKGLGGLNRNQVVVPLHRMGAE